MWDGWQVHVSMQNDILGVFLLFSCKEKIKQTQFKALTTARGQHESYSIWVLEVSMKC